MAEGLDRALGEMAARADDVAAPDTRNQKSAIDLSDSRSLAEAWVADLQRQIARLEREIDALHDELREQRSLHAEEMRRKDVLLQGAQVHISALTDRLKALPPPAAPAAPTPAPAKPNGAARLSNFEVPGWPMLDR